jgi:Divergent InlB B-repeat domain
MTRRVRALALAAAGAFLVLAPSAASGPEALPRSGEDRTDDFPGPQVHVLYVLPRDGADRALDTNGVAEASVASWQRWLRAQTGGRGIRLDTFQGQLDVSFLRLGRTVDVVVGRLDLIAEDLVASGFNRADRIYAIYYDGGGAGFTCGGAGRSPLPVRVAAIFLQSAPPGGQPCPTTAVGRDPPAYFDFALLHEIVHTMGFVPSCAPHITERSHVSDSPFDLMWSGAAPWGVYEPSRMQLDVGRDDYYEARIPGCPDLSGSRFFEGGGVRLTLDVPSGSGIVNLSQGEEGCSVSCVRYFDALPPQRVTLTVAHVERGKHFVGWTGSCTGSAPTCVVDLDADKTVEALFGPAMARLAVGVAGRGTVRSAPRGIACPRRCSAAFLLDARVTLRATPQRGWRFAGWRGACGGTRACTVAISGNRAVRAVFRRAF